MKMEQVFIRALVRDRNKMKGKECNTLHRVIVFFLLIYRLERERERNINLLFHLFMHSLVDSCRCPDQGWNLQHWHIETML